MEVVLAVHEQSPKERMSSVEPRLELQGELAEARRLVPVAGVARSERCGVDVTGVGRLETRRPGKLP